MPASSWPRRSDSTGIASTSSSRTLPTAHGHGRLLTLRPHRANALFSWVCAASATCAFAAARSARERTRLRVSDRNAGTRVSAESMVTATTIAEARPSAPTNGTAET